MKVDKLAGERFKEKPADCTIDSHALLLRGGYMKQVASGIFSLYTPLKRVTAKIERIIREEMDALDGQEVMFPVVMPGSLWEESGRYYSVDDELVRFTDRNKSQFVLGMTHEEAAVQLVREYGSSYARYPFMIYQIQTKFRDEARPRGGLIRVREFTMKDAYSFHTSQEDLDEYFDRCLHAYERIYNKAGLDTVIPVLSDSGMMGGSVSREFMLPVPVGEDTVIVCSECGCRANLEVSENEGECPDICPRCGKKSVTLSRAVEVGHIFQLGSKYTKAMGMQYMDRAGGLQYPLMGCYGIGVGRLAASICEAHHDEQGPVWPMSVAPWQVHICCVRADEPEVKAHADRLYAELMGRGIEVLYDDRVISAGIMFSDADLLGVPLRVIVSPRNIKEACCEIVTRDRRMAAKAAIDNAAAAVERLIRDCYN